ncbi:hypothetical protein HYC85_026493 [Camellia sinensis]|uniref:Inositol oxygenase n=1 Tax=Camellia sinensis TaxID=4442 RepID=A0A7J7G7R5_CAMSI|nr:hypothetical protein HYC85_026493 [Camellia sinensis]
MQVKRMREDYGKLDKVEMSIWECCELLNDVVDDSDPDLDEPQIEHLLQTAEAIRKDYPDEDWLHLTGLIHDLGKVLLHPSFGGLPQWAVVGDTFPLGCAFDESIVHHKYFEYNSDSKNSTYCTKNGIYSEGCGLDNVMISWGHDNYMYLVAKENGTTLPPAALFIIRYHSFYPLHKSGAYKHLMNEDDVENLKWLKIFNKYDLYSKSKVRIDVEKVKPYYLTLIEKVSTTLVRKLGSTVQRFEWSHANAGLEIVVIRELHQRASQFFFAKRIGAPYDMYEVRHKLESNYGGNFSRIEHRTIQNSPFCFFANLTTYAHLQVIYRSATLMDLKRDDQTSAFAYIQIMLRARLHPKTTA